MQDKSEQGNEAVQKISNCSCFDGCPGRPALVKMRAMVLHLETESRPASIRLGDVAANILVSTFEELAPRDRISGS